MTSGQVSSLFAYMFTTKMNTFLRNKNEARQDELLLLCFFLGMTSHLPMGIQAFQEPVFVFWKQLQPGQSQCFILMGIMTTQGQSLDQMKPMKMSLGVYQETILCFLLTLTLKGHELRTAGLFQPYHSHENTTAQRTYSQTKEHRNWALNSATPEVRLLISMTRRTNAFPPLLQLEWVS